MVLPFIRLKGSEAHIILVSKSASAKLDKRSLVAYLECFSAIVSKFRYQEAIAKQQKLDARSLFSCLQCRSAIASKFRYRKAIALTVKTRCAIAILFWCPVDR